MRTTNLSHTAGFRTLLIWAVESVLILSQEMPGTMARLHTFNRASFRKSRLSLLKTYGHRVQRERT